MLLCFQQRNVVKGGAPWLTALSVTQLEVFLIILNGLKDPKSKVVTPFLLLSQPDLSTNERTRWVPGVTVTKTETTADYEVFL